MSEAGVERPPYHPATDTPEDQPDPRRIGLIRHDPLEHFCAVCGRFGAFGGDRQVLKLPKGMPHTAP
jgi:hypothetical protein